MGEVIRSHSGNRHGEFSHLDAQHLFSYFFCFIIIFPSSFFQKKEQGGSSEITAYEQKHRR